MSTLTLSQRTQQLPRQHPKLFLAAAACVWLALYQALSPASEALVAALPDMSTARETGELSPGRAAPAMLALIEITRRLRERAERLPSGLRA